MGMSPLDVGQCSLWELMAASDGWKAAHGGDDSPPPMSDDRAATLGIDGLS